MKGKNKNGFCKLLEMAFGDRKDELVEALISEIQEFVVIFY